MTLISSLAISPDNQRALAGTLDSYVYLWDVVAGAEILGDDRWARRYERSGGGWVKVETA